MITMADYSDFQSQQDSIDRNRKLAALLQQQSMTPDNGQMVSGHYVAPSNVGLLAKLLQGVVGGVNQKALDEKQATLRSDMNEDRIGSIQRYADLLQGKEAVAAKYSNDMPEGIT